MTAKRIDQVGESVSPLSSAGECGAERLRMPELERLATEIWILADTLGTELRKNETGPSDLLCHCIDAKQLKDELGMGHQDWVRAQKSILKNIDRELQRRIEEHRNATSRNDQWVARLTALRADFRKYPEQLDATFRLRMSPRPGTTPDGKAAKTQARRRSDLAILEDQVRTLGRQLLEAIEEHAISATKLRSACRALARWEFQSAAYRRSGGEARAHVQTVHESITAPGGDVSDSTIERVRVRRKMQPWSAPVAALAQEIDNALTATRSAPTAAPAKTQPQTKPKKPRIRYQSHRTLAFRLATSSKSDYAITRARDVSERVRKQAAELRRTALKAEGAAAKIGIPTQILHRWCRTGLVRCSYEKSEQYFRHTRNVRYWTLRDAEAIRKAAGALFAYELATAAKRTSSRECRTVPKAENP